MDYAEYSKNVWNYLPSPIAYPEDKDQLEEEVKLMFDKGWTWIECARYMRCREEVDGSDDKASMTEDQALARMKNIVEDVRTRLGRHDV